MKEFMLIFIGEDVTNRNMSPEQMQAQMGKWFTWIDSLKAKGTYVEGRALIPTAKTVKGKKAVLTDGPFAESKEIVGGYFIVNASSFEEAANIAKGCPDFELGTAVEVREVMKM
jgi:hypothetical protein